MSRSVIPVNIRPHLVPFLYEEFEGVQESYLHKKVKAVKIKNGSILGNIIKLLADKSELPLKVDCYNVFLSVKNQSDSSFFGGIYKVYSGEYSFLRLPEEGTMLINGYLENIFRLTFTSFILGYTTKKKGDTSEGIHLFLDAYNLREYGFSEPTLRKIYDNESKPGTRLVRFQKRLGNRFMNYS